MTRIALLIEYTGEKLHGSQLQVGVRTVQSELEAAIAVLAKQEIRVTFSGRTDSGVNATGQVVHFEWPENGMVLHSRSDEADPVQLQSAAVDTGSTSNGFIDTWRLATSLNGIMKNDVSVRAVQIVSDDFHARFSAIQRQYVYRILNRPHRSALLKDTHYHIQRELALKPMQDAASALLGKHDFSSFRSSNADNSSPICTVSRSELFNLGEGQLEFWIAADHFVYNMVRIIVGTLVEIGLGKREPDCVREALLTSNRDLCGPTAPPRGLTLDSVVYPAEYKLFERDSFI